MAKILILISCKVLIGIQAETTKNMLKNYELEIKGKDQIRNYTFAPYLSIT